MQSALESNILLKRNNKSNIAIVVLHEIYGINEHIKSACLSFSKQGYSVYSPNLLKTNQVFSYAEENKAYENFINNIGFQDASHQVKEVLMNIKNKYKYIFIIGYSVGATIAWLCSGEKGMCNGVVGFYGSRIRAYTDIVPQCPVLLFFPEQEKSFAVNRLINYLNKEPNVTVKQLQGKHGFGDPYNKYFVQASYCAANEQMFDFIKNMQIIK